LRESHLTLPTIRHALGELTLDELPSTDELERADAAWEASRAIDAAEDIVRGLGESRFEVLQRVERAGDEAWNRLNLMLLSARQHELEHLAAMWRVALYWDQVTSSESEPRFRTSFSTYESPCRQASGVTLR
jgi:hypothetical protein